MNSMNEHPSQELLDGYRRRDLTPDVFLAVNNHLESCGGCQTKCGSFRASNQDFANLYSAALSDPGEAPYHLAYDEVSGYVNGELDEVDVETIETHLEVCAQCKDDVEGLRAARADISLGGAAIGSLADARRSRRVSAFYWIAAAAAIVIIALILFQTLNTRKPRPEVVDKTPSEDPQVPKPPSEGDHQPNGSPEDQPPKVQPATAYAIIDGTRRVLIDEQTNVRGVEDLPTRLQQSVQTALRVKELKQPAVLSELREPRATLSGPGNAPAFQPLSPVGKVIETNRPTLRWGPLTGASSYTVTVSDAKLNEIVTSPPLTGLEWKVTKPLEYGAIYTWQVSAFKDGKTVRSPVLPEPQAKFKVLDRNLFEELETVRQKQPDSHLALGVLYAQSGMVDEAEREFSALLNANPNVDVVRSLLRSVQSFKRK